MISLSTTFSIFLDKDKYMLDLHIYANVEIAGNMGKLNQHIKNIINYG